MGAGTAQVSTSVGASVRRLLTLGGNLTTNGNDFVTEADAAGTSLVYNNGGATSVYALRLQTVQGTIIKKLTAE